jgi:hypothetical protein
MIIALSDSVMTKADRLRLESFAAHLVAHGCAARWDWQRKRGLDLTLHLYKGRTDREPMVYFRRSRTDRAFCARDAGGRIIAQGDLPHVLTVVDRFARLYGDTFRA